MTQIVEILSQVENGGLPTYPYPPPSVILPQVENSGLSYNPPPQITVLMDDPDTFPS